MTETTKFGGEGSSPLPNISRMDGGGDAPSSQTANVGIHAHTIHHVLTFTQDQLIEMLVSAYLLNRKDFTQENISQVRHHFEIRLSQEYFRQRKEAMEGAKDAR